jgi:hypothetical protein
VKLLRIITALTVLAAWLPATSHCLLAGVGALTDSCCEDSHPYEEAPDGSHDDCGTCVVESGNFKLADADHFHFDFQATLSWRLQLPQKPEPDPGAALLDSGRAPPDLARWHFQTRAALPGRAPDSIA